MSLIYNFPLQLGSAILSGHDQGQTKESSLVTSTPQLVVLLHYFVIFSINSKTQFKTVTRNEYEKSRWRYLRVTDRVTLMIFAGKENITYYIGISEMYVRYISNANQ